MLLFLVIAAIFSIIPMLLWNALIPDIFGLTTITYWQALGLVVLARVLFGGFGINHRDFAKRHNHSGHRNALREKWLNMSDEERKEYLQNHRLPNFFRDMWEERPDARQEVKPTSTETEDNND